MQNNNRPIKTKIEKERVDTYPNAIYSYMSVVVDEKIMFLRIAFKTEETKVTYYDKITIKKTSWSLRHADELLSCEFPEDQQIKEDTKEDLYKHFENWYKENVGKAISFKFTSGIKSISDIDLDEANGEIIKLKIEFIYNLGKFLHFTNYRTKMYVYYKYNKQDNKFECQNLEVFEKHVV
jgi:hypothetical protein